MLRNLFLRTPQVAVPEIEPEVVFVGRIERVPVDALAERAAGDAVQILDVREQQEWNTGHIPLHTTTH